MLWAFSEVNPPPPQSVQVGAANGQQLVIGDWRGGPDRELAQVANRKLTLDLFDPSTITFDVTGFPDPRTGRFDASLLAEGISDVMWRRNGAALMRGRLTQTQDKIDANGHTVSCTVVDYRALLDRRLVLQDITGPLAGSGKKSFGSIPLTDIVWQLIDDAQHETGGDMGLTKGLWPPATPVYNAYEVPDGDTVWSAIKKLAAPSSVAVVTEHTQPNGTNVKSANLPGFDIEIDANKRVNMFYPTRSNDKGVKLDYVAGSGGVITGIQRSIDMANYANFIRQSGGGELATANPTGLGSFIRLPSDDLAGRPEGRWDISASDPDVLTEETLRGAAAKSYNLYAKLQPTYDLTLATDFWEPAMIGLGDVVTVAVQSGRLSLVDKLRVVRITVTVDSSNRETVELTVGRPRPDVFKFLSASVRNLNRR